MQHQEAWATYYSKVMTGVEQALIDGGDKPMAAIKARVQAVAKWALDGYLPEDDPPRVDADRGDAAAATPAKAAATTTDNGQLITVQVADLQASWSSPAVDPTAHQWAHQHAHIR